MLKTPIQFLVKQVACKQPALPSITRKRATGLARQDLYERELQDDGIGRPSDRKLPAIRSNSSSFMSFDPKNTKVEPSTSYQAFGSLMKSFSSHSLKIGFDGSSIGCMTQPTRTARARPLQAEV